jgi:hypothetical protein
VKRSTAIAVLVTAAVLVAAGQLPSLPWQAAAATWRSSVASEVGSWPQRVRSLSVQLPRTTMFTRHTLAKPAAVVPQATARVLQRPRFSPPRLLVTPFAPGFRPRPIVTPLVWLGAGLAALLVALLVTLAWRRAGDPRGRVFQMARRGLPAERIARHARVPQDAVRTLLTPGLGARRS